jgi:hypothetical protein
VMRHARGDQDPRPSKAVVNPHFIEATLAQIRRNRIASLAPPVPSGQQQANRLETLGTSLELVDTFARLRRERKGVE